MSLKLLQERQTQLLMQRLQGKDIIEMAERELGAVGLAMRELNAYIEEEKKVAEAKLSNEVLADVLKFPAGNKDPVVDEELFPAPGEEEGEDAPWRQPSVPIESPQSDTPVEDFNYNEGDDAKAPEVCPPLTGAGEISTTPLDTDGPDSVA